MLQILMGVIAKEQKDSDEAQSATKKDALQSSFIGEDWDIDFLTLLSESRII